ncbi:MAG: hypothetical protein A2X67_08050 [Ignavibacteria bacterium GWA2_55_11]|nr:MAG: hypothetical protein A2X67_08050 [Ignavibacteria bacterium GWA2_55_11]OGU63136.1 MAG: hypothetical protein A3C56_06620 [Ignavibacteria bacterium RIFCSPHIGHO2_02_FULL_56_12]OGU73756.1 MAG: hypothetical protein A3H45_12975 [Ignavibacteria bacterium RIFCSPLOWO2_02_FULL_55_14]OGU77021.1 MAG: hypothetical protein A3G43_07495 [Ignavibacteria bacterium RIFCSPLOWO2_12_FULL_56_21]HAV22802.1 hypothetical protein [Bacteroidota bacterium]
MMSLLKILFHHAVIISPTFHTSALPYKISNSTFARRQFRFQLRSCLASDVNTISGRIVHLHNWLAKVTRVETVHTTLQEGSMKNFTGLFASVLLLVVGTTLTAFSQTVIFSEDFETGTASSQWGVYYRQPGTTLAEDSVKAVPMAQAPAALAGGGNYVGWLQDLDGTYTGSAVAVAGFTGLQDYSIEADVYVYVGASASSYTGLVVYADSSKKEFYKLRADLDASNRVNLSNLKSNPSTFAPYFNKDFTVAQNPGLFPTVSGWHKMKLEVRTTSVDSITIWSYFDGTLIANNPVKDTARMTSGQFGLYSFKQSATGLAAYFDNIVVKTLVVTGVGDVTEDQDAPRDFGLAQNYPNPFNPATVIQYRLSTASVVDLRVFDLLGREVAVLATGERSAGTHNVEFDASRLPSGMYLYRLSTGEFTQTKKMLLTK